MTSYRHFFECLSQRCSQNKSLQRIAAWCRDALSSIVSCTDCLGGRVIRKYQPADCEGVLRVWAQASALAHPFLSENFLELERHNIPNIYLPNAETWVWVADGQVVGFISLLGNEVGAVFVDPEFHRSGIGRALVDRARALRGELEVEVFERNLLGRAFYAKLGFELMHQKVHDQTGFDVMRLRLAANNPLQPTGYAGG